jgi:hypothetical protein
MKNKSIASIVSKAKSFGITLTSFEALCVQNGTVSFAKLIGNKTVAFEL